MWYQRALILVLWQPLHFYPLNKRSCLTKKAPVISPSRLPWTQPIPTMFIIQTNLDTCWCQPNWTMPIINPGKQQWYTHLRQRRNSDFIDGILEMSSREKYLSQFELWNQCNSMILSRLSDSNEAEIAAGVIHAKTVRQV